MYNLFLELSTEGPYITILDMEKSMLHKFGKKLHIWKLR